MFIAYDRKADTPKDYTGFGDKRSAIQEVEK